MTINIEEFAKIKNERDSFLQSLRHSEIFMNSYTKRYKYAINVLRDKGEYGIEEAIKILEGIE